MISDKRKVIKAYKKAYVKPFDIMNYTTDWAIALKEMNEMLYMTYLKYLDMEKVVGKRRAKRIRKKMVKLMDKFYGGV